MCNLLKTTLCKNAHVWSVQTEYHPVLKYTSDTDNIKYVYKLWFLFEENENIHPGNTSNVCSLCFYWISHCGINCRIENTRMQVSKSRSNKYDISLCFPCKSIACPLTLNVVHLAFYNWSLLFVGVIMHHSCESIFCFCPALRGSVQLWPALPRA